MVTTLTADEMTALAGQIGAKPQICVNLSLARFIPGPDSVEAAAHYAADWVRHVNGNAATYTRYWEVGNEHYGSWQAGWLVNGDTMDGAYYGRAFCIFADSMKAADPRSEEHTSELQSPDHIVCRLLLEKKKTILSSQAAPQVALLSGTPLPILLY